MSELASTSVKPAWLKEHKKDDTGSTSTSEKVHIDLYLSSTCPQISQYITHVYGPGAFRTAVSVLSDSVLSLL